MEFTIRSAEHWDMIEKRMIETLEDLEKLYNDYNKYDLIINFENKIIAVCQPY